LNYDNNKRNTLILHLNRKRDYRMCVKLLVLHKSFRNNGGWWYLFDC